MSPLVKFLSRTSLSLFTLNFKSPFRGFFCSSSSLIRPTRPDFVLCHWCLSRCWLRPFQTWQQKLKKQTNMKSVSCLCGYHFSIIDEMAIFLQHRRMFLLPVSGCCCFDPCRPYWQLVVVLVFNHHSLFDRFVIWIKRECLAFTGYDPIMLWTALF